MIQTGVRTAFVTALLFVPSRAIAQTFDWKASLDQPLSPGTVAVLVEHGAVPAVQERWRQALRHEDPFVRAAAARAIYAAGARELVPALKEALGAEKDDDAAIEEVRAIVALGTPADDEAILAAGTRFAQGTRTSFWHQLGRARGEAALAYLSKVRESDDAHESRRGLACSVIRGQEQRLLSVAAMAIRDTDPALWDVVWEALRGRLGTDQKYVQDSLQSYHPRIRAITYWNVAMMLHGGGKLPKFLDDSIRATPEGRVDNALVPSTRAAHDARFAFELLRRSRGRKPREDLDWVGGVESQAPWPFPGLLPPVAGLLTKGERAVLITKEHLSGNVDWMSPVQRWRGPPVGHRRQGARAAGLLDFPPGYVSGLAEQTECRDARIVGKLAYSAQGRPTHVDIERADLSEACAFAGRSLMASYPYRFARCAEPIRLAQEPHDQTLALTLLERTTLEYDRQRAARSAPAVDGATTVEDVVTLPKILKKPSPEYPRQAAIARIEGVVLIEATLDANGRVASARVIDGVEGLDEAALANVLQWEFSPAVRKGVPVAIVVYAEVRFRLS